MTDWDRRFIDLAQHVSTWSKDPSTQVGAVIVDANRRVVSVGFNGFPRGVGDDERMQNRATKYEMTVHAEVNALMFANRGVDGCTVYVWPIPPCARCAAQLIQAGIARVVSPPPTERWVESCSLGTAMLAEAEVEIDQIPGVETIPDTAILVDNDAPPFRPAEIETVPPSLSSRPLLEETHQKLIGLKERNRELEERLEGSRLANDKLHEQIGERDRQIKEQAQRITGQADDIVRLMDANHKLTKHLNVLEQDHVAEQATLRKQAEDRELLILQLRKQIERDAAQAALDDTKIRDQAVELAVLRGQVKERENRLTHLEMLRKHTKVLDQDHTTEQATLRKQVEAQRLLILDLRKQIDALQAETLKRDKQLLEMSGHLEGARKRGNSLQFMISARQQELERQNADLVAANNKLLERARVAENKVVVLERSHA